MRPFLPTLLLPLALATPSHAGGLDLPKDKTLHLLAGAVIAVPVYLAAKAEGRRFPELWAVGASLLAGILKELHDRKEPGNRFDAGDALATVAGGVVINFAIRW